MKYRTHFVASTAVLLVVIGGVMMFNTGNNTPQKLHTSSVKATRTTAPTSTSKAVETPAAAPEAPIQTAAPVTATGSTRAEQNRTDLQAATIEKSTQIAMGLGRTGSLIDVFTAGQWACVDKYITQGNGYDVDYNSLLTNSAYVVLRITPNPNGTTSYNFFQGPMSCPTATVTV